MNQPDNQDQFLAQVREVLEAHYHHRHEFHLRMHAGKLSRDEVRDWVRNRYCYQARMPIKDSIILSKLPSREARRAWVGRIVDQDGGPGDEGGLEAWLRLAKGVGLSREETVDESRAEPGVRFAVDAYVNFCRERTWQEGVAASLTQLFVPDLLKTRMEAFRTHYGVRDEDMAYFERHGNVAARESQQAIDLLVSALRSREDQQAALAAVRFKCDVLNALLDTIDAIR